MAKPYDATLKQLIDAYAADWLAWLRPRLGVPADAAFEALDADLGTVSPQADKLFRFTDPALGLRVEARLLDGTYPDQTSLDAALAVAPREVLTLALRPGSAAQASPPRP